METFALVRPAASNQHTGVYIYLDEGVFFVVTFFLCFWDYFHLDEGACSCVGDSTAYEACTSKKEI